MAHLVCNVNCKETLDTTGIILGTALSLQQERNYVKGNALKLKQHYNKLIHDQFLIITK